MPVYNLTKNIDSESNSANFIDVGIHDNIVMDRVEFKQSPKGNYFLAFYFKDEEGKELSHTEWEPTDDDPKKLEDKITNQMKRVKHIATKFISEDDFVFDANDFKDFAEKTIKSLDGKYNNKKVRIKVVYSWNNYTSLPNYVPFIESMDIPKDKSNLSITSIDKMKKDQPDVETRVVSDDPFRNIDEDDTKDDRNQESLTNAEGELNPNKAFDDAKKENNPEGSNDDLPF